MFVPGIVSNMKRVKCTTIKLCIAVAFVTLFGCRVRQKPLVVTSNVEPASQTHFVQYPDVYVDDEGGNSIAAPRTNLTELPDAVWEMSLDEAIMLALEDTEVLRSLGATVVSNPQVVGGSFDPAIQSTDPNFGIEAALAQFDARFNSSLLYAKDDDVLNNSVLGGGATEIRDDLTTGSYGLSKTTAAGTQFSINSSFQHSQSNNPGLLFADSWTTVWEATARQPLLQGRGVRFNRIAGPVTQPGVRNTSGVVISRINHDITIAQFEANLRRMIEEIIVAYWQLDLAYKNFDAIRSVRDLGLETWQVAKSRYDNDLPGGEADREAQAREQYYQFQSQLLVALNGSRPSGEVGVLQAEANLRRLLGLPQSGSRMIKPSDRPILVQTIYNWEDLANNTINSRVEIREQLWRVKQRKLELEAAQNFLLPRLDAVATYRNNGFGDDLIGGNGRFAGALNDAFTNDHGEWELGLSYNMTLGMRQAHVGVRNAELAYHRERAVLAEQREQILHDLGSAVRQVDQSYSDIELQANRLEAARTAVEARTAAFEADTVGFDELLNSHQRLLQSELAFFQTASSFEQAKATLQSQSGRLLREYQINLNEENVYDQ